MVRVITEKVRCLMTNKRKRNSYSEEFKRDAVQLVIEQGYSSREVCRRLGVNSSLISRWVREYHQQRDNGHESGASRRELEVEIRRLKKENKRLEMEREILKKAAAFFAKESS